MKRPVLILFFCFFVLSASLYAGTVKLVTYYPAPTGAYNKIIMPTQANPCGGLPANQGLLFLASNGSLNVCDNTGTAQVYPKQCYNIFCSGACAVVCAAPSSPCACGYGVLAGATETFAVDSTHSVTSEVCCGGS
jgi:hypothetical protein